MVSHTNVEMSKKQYLIWEFFIIGEDTHLAKCNICGEDISGGGKTTSTFNTTSSVYHLKTNFVDEFHDYSKVLEISKGKRASVF